MKFVIFLFILIIQFIQCYANELVYSMDTYRETDLGIQSTNVVVESNLNYIYVSSAKGVLQALDFKNNNKILKQETVCPVIVHLLLDPQENYLYIACESYGLLIYRIYKDETQIFDKVYEYLDNHAYYLVLIQSSSNILYCTSEDGFFTLDVTDPTSPQFLLQVNGLGFADQFEVSDDQKFIFLAKDSNGFETYDISNPSSPELVVFHPFTGTYGVRYIRKHPTQKLLFIMTKWDYMAVIDYNEFYSYSAPYSLTYTEYATFVDETFSEKNDFWFSSDGNYFFMTCQSVGIFIVNMEDVTNMYLYQIISYSQILKRMFVPSINDDFIFLTNAKQLLIYQKTSLIYQQKNLFTQYQSEIWSGPTLETWPWGSTFSHNYDYYWVSLTVDGLRCYDSSKLPELTLVIEYTSAIIPGFNSPFNVHKHLTNEHIIFVGMYVEEALVILDVTDVLNPIKLSSLTFTDKIAYFLLPFPSTPDKLSLNIRTDMLIIDVSDLSNPYVYSSTDLAAYSVTQMKNQAISLDENYIYVPEQVLGTILTLKISNAFTKIELIDQTEYELVYNLKVSKKHAHILYVLTAIGGVRIYNTEGGKPQLISEVLLDGFLWQVDFTVEEHILFVVATQKNQLQSIDISDPYNPRLIHVFQVSGEQAFQVIYTHRADAKNYVLINTFSGIRAIPDENDIELNKQVYKYDTELLQYSQYEFQNDELYPIFYVGEKGQIKYQVLNNPLQKKIAQFYYYNVEQPEELQSSSDFTKFDNANKLVTFEATSENIGFNTIVAKVYIFIDKSEIEVDGLIDSDLALKIYSRAQEFGYIDSNGYPSSLFNINQAIILLNDDNLQEYADHLKNIIKYKIQFVPFSFQVDPSLYFNYELKNSTTNNLIIQTYSQESIQITLSVQPEYAEFFSQSFQGVLSSYSDNFSEIIVQGRMANLNKIMDQIKIEIRDSSYYNLIQLRCQIDDQLNNIIDETHYLSEIGFIQINSHVEVGDSIQDQFNSQYPQGSITLESEFQFTFRIESFLDDDDLQYSIEVFIPENDQFEEITQSESFQYFDISFQASERLIKGEVERTFYTSSIKININATDGYSTVSQQLKINADKVPFLIIAYYLILVGSSLLSIIGAIQYRGQIYGMFCKSRYRIGNFYFQENDKFKLQIILCKYEFYDTQKYLKMLESYLQKKKFTFAYLLDQTKKNQFIFDRNKIKRILYRQNPDLDQDGYDSETAYHYQLLKSLLYQKIIKQNSQSLKLLNKLKKHAMNNSTLNKHRWYEYYVEIQPVEITDNYGIVPKIYFKNSVLFNALNVVQKKEKNVVKKLLKSITHLAGNQQLNRQSIGENYSPIECYELEHEIFRKKVNEYQEASNNNCYYFLILEALRAHALGFIDQGLFSFLNYTAGQCLKKDTSEVGVAKGMTKRRSIFNPLYKLLNMDYVDIPLAQNTPLPQWMDYQCHQGVIELFGQMPQDISKQTNQNQCEIMIRIEDIFHFICREFYIIQVPIKRKNLLIETDQDAESQQQKNRELEALERQEELKQKILKKNEDEIFQRVASTYNKLDLSTTIRDEIHTYNQQSKYQQSTQIPNMKSSFQNQDNQQMTMAKPFKINSNNIDQFFRNKGPSIYQNQQSKHDSSQFSHPNQSPLNLENQYASQDNSYLNNNIKNINLNDENHDISNNDDDFNLNSFNNQKNLEYSRNKQKLKEKQKVKFKNQQEIESLHEIQQQKKKPQFKNNYDNQSIISNNNSKMQLNNDYHDKSLNDISTSQIQLTGRNKLNKNYQNFKDFNDSDVNDHPNYTFEGQKQLQKHQKKDSKNLDKSEPNSQDNSESEIQYDDYQNNNYQKNNYNKVNLNNINDKKILHNKKGNISNISNQNDGNGDLTSNRDNFTKRMLLDLQD